MVASVQGLVLDGTDGGYVLSAFSEAGSTELVVTPYPPGEGAVVGSVIALPHVAFVRTLGGLRPDERVRLTVFALNDPPPDADYTQSKRNFPVECRFELDALGPILAWSLGRDLQAQAFDKPGHFQCSLHMRIEQEPIDRGDPHETHILEIWPTIVSEQTIGWYDRDLDLSLESNLRLGY